MSRRVLLALAVAVGAIGVGAAALLVLAGDGEDPAPALPAAHLERCDSIVAGYAGDCYTREILAMVEDRDDPRPAVEAITKASRRDRGFLLANCHVVMHTVGRTYAREAGVTLATLMDYLPRGNDPGCAAGLPTGS